MQMPLSLSRGIFTLPSRKNGPNPRPKADGMQMPPSLSRGIFTSPLEKIPMDTRCRNDLVGCRSRLQSTLSKWGETTAIIEETWNDETAKTFYTQSLGEVEPVLKRMMSSLLEAADLVHKMEKMVVDTDKYE